MKSVIIVIRRYMNNTDLTFLTKRFLARAGRQ